MTKEYYMLAESGEVFTTAHPEYHKECQQLSAAEGKRLHLKYAIKRMRELLAGVDTVYGIVRKVSASGMSRNIDLYIIKDNRMVYLTGWASIVLGYKRMDRGMVVRGCGMDMVFACVSSLAEACGFDYKAIRSEVI